MSKKQQRYIDGVPVPNTLYADPKKRPGKYRFRKPDGGFKTFDAPDVHEAIKIVEKASRLIENDVIPHKAGSAPVQKHLAFHIPRYIEYRENLNPKLAAKKSWKSNRCNALKALATPFPLLKDLTNPRIREWWDSLGHHQQKQRHAEFRRFFNWLMAEELVPQLKFNPFTLADDLPRLLNKEKPEKERPPLTEEGYQVMLNKAAEMGYDALRVAMGISRYTTLRRQDVVALKWDVHLVDGQLRVLVAKSEAQKGTMRASRLFWELKKHPELKALIDEARELRIAHSRCPFIISHKPRRSAWNCAGKEHWFQVTEDRLTRMYQEVRSAIIEDEAASKKEKALVQGTTFHEVRGLASTLLKKKGYSDEQIQEVMAHESISTTKGYQNAEALPYEEVLLVL